MSTTGNALKMRLQLKNLAVRHRVHNQPCKLPLFDPVEHDMTMCGYASTDDRDLDRCKMRAYAFGYPMLFQKGYPKLHLKHDTSREVGRIDTLQYDELGNLQIWATVSDREAKRYPAFSIAAKVIDYEIVNGDTPDFYALITQAELTEISLTDNPSNPYALVMDRHRVSPQIKINQLMIAKVKCLTRLVTLIKEVNHGSL